jgi:hypothetical protein
VSPPRSRRDAEASSSSRFTRAYQAGWRLDEHPLCTISNAVSRPEGRACRQGVGAHLADGPRSLSSRVSCTQRLLHGPGSQWGSHVSLSERVHTRGSCAKEASKAARIGRIECWQHNSG